MSSRTWTEWLSARDLDSLRNAIRAYRVRHGRGSAWIVAATYAGCLAAFFADLTSNNTLAFGVFYTPMIVTAMSFGDRRAVWVLTFVACAMATVGSMVPGIPTDWVELVANRALSVGALLATAVFVWRARVVQDQLAEQTSRAEAAERIKTEVLSNLSQEIRAPLYSMIGVMEIVGAGSGPEQSAALGMIRISGRRLVATVDNLVDLTQFEDKPLPVEPVELSQLLRRTAEARRVEAAARQIALTVEIPPDRDTLVTANAWALRRILDNTIADGITYSAPGGRVDIGVSRENGHASAAIVTTGTWPQGAYEAVNDPNAAPLTPSVMGLALSQRLARAMDARLVFRGGPGEGTTVTLTMPTTSRPRPLASPTAQDQNGPRQG